MKHKEINPYQIPEDLKFTTAEVVKLKGISFKVDLDVSKLQDTMLNGSRIKTMKLSIEMSKGGSEILVSGRIYGKMEHSCSRCLKPFVAQYKDDFVETISIADEIIDIMEMVKQTLLLDNRIQNICKEECKGLCVVCGENLNERDCGCKAEKPSPFAILKDKYGKGEKNA